MDLSRAPESFVLLGRLLLSDQAHVILPFHRAHDSAGEESGRETKIGTTKRGIGLAYGFMKIFSVGVLPQLGYHYFFGGADEEPTQTDQNSAGWDFSALGFFRVYLGI